MITARSEAERVLNENRKEIKRIKERAVQQISAEIGGLVFQSASIIIDHVLDAAKHRELIEHALDNVPFDGVLKEEGISVPQK